MELIYFILGFFVASYGIPIIDGFSSWLLTWVETKKIKQNEIINQTNIKIRQAASSAEADPPMHQIGFCVSDGVNPEEEEDENV